MFWENLIGLSDDIAYFFWRTEEKKAQKRREKIKGHDENRWGREWVTSAIDSDFIPGSSYFCAIANKIRGLIGSKFEDIISSPKFREALEKGTVLGELGSGGFGKVYKMETSFGGEKFTYIKKVARGNVLDRTSEVELGSLKREHKIMEEIRLAEGGRSEYTAHSYGVNKEGTVLYQEYLEGSVAGTETTTEQALGFLNLIKRLSKKGFSHGDISYRNLFVHKTGQTMFVDLGMAERASDVGRSHFVKTLLDDIQQTDIVANMSPYFLSGNQSAYIKARDAMVDSLKKIQTIETIRRQETRQILHNGSNVDNLRSMNPKKTYR